MKTMLAFFLFAGINFVASAQAVSSRWQTDFTISKPSHRSVLFASQTYERRFVQLYQNTKEPHSPARIKKLRTASIVLATIGGGLHILGFTMNAAGTMTYNFYQRNTLYGIGGVSNVVGLGTGIADMGTWIAYAVQMKKYKRRQQTVR
ncbi:MAG: hypothetical protein JST83_08325 [Bacteroidetes bacterium]|nr:hypothetical protein [Bacteroidota bacterium]